MRKPVRRRTVEPYKHYRREIVVELFADTITLRLKGTRKRYSIPVSHLLDYLCRLEVTRAQLARARARKEKKRLERK